MPTHRLTLPGVHPAPRRRARTTPTVVLVWHDIVPARKLVWFDTTVCEFEEQLLRLEKARARPISLDALYKYLTTGAPVPPPGATVLCFDDNTRGIYDHAFPRLARRGWPFVVCAHTAYVGVRTGKDHNTWEQLRRMERGGARVVSQTHTHPPDLRALSDAALAREMTDSRMRMDEAMGRPTRFVTYPSGTWDRRVAVAAFMAGYRMGLTEDRGPAESSPHLLGLHRYSTHRRFDEAVRAIARASSVAD